MNYYKMLGLDQKASPAEIALARQDLRGRMTPEMERAFQVLSSPHLREEYDRQLNRPAIARISAWEHRPRKPIPEGIPEGVIVLVIALLLTGGFISLIFMSGSMSYQLRDAGNEALELGDLYTALQKHRRAVDISHQNPDYRADLARTYLALERYPDAITEYTLALEMDPEHPASLTGRAQAFQQLGNQDMARKDLNAARLLGIPAPTP